VKMFILSFSISVEDNVTCVGAVQIVVTMLIGR
jgi:hypothetical protein